MADLGQKDGSVWMVMAGSRHLDGGVRWWWDSGIERGGSQNHDGGTFMAGQWHQDGNIRTVSS